MRRHVGALGMIGLHVSGWRKSENVVKPCHPLPLPLFLNTFLRVLKDTGSAAEGTEQIKGLPNTEAKNESFTVCTPTLAASDNSNQQVVRNGTAEMGGSKVLQATDPPGGGPYE